MPAHSFEEWTEGALTAQGLGQEVEGALRAALVEVALGLAAAARREEAGVRRAVLEEGGSACSRDLRCSCARHRRATNSVVICSENASRVELAQSEERAADFQYFAQARVLGVKLRRRVAIACVLQDANQAAGLVDALDFAFIISAFGALVSVPNDLSRDFVGPLQVLCELGSVGTHVARRLRQR